MQNGSQHNRQMNMSHGNNNVPHSNNMPQRNNVSHRNQVSHNNQVPHRNMTPRPASQQPRRVRHHTAQLPTSQSNIHTSNQHPTSQSNIHSSVQTQQQIHNNSSEASPLAVLNNELLPSANDMISSPFDQFENNNFVSEVSHIIL